MVSSRALSLPRSTPMYRMAQCTKPKTSDPTQFTDGVIGFVDVLEQHATIIQAAFLRYPVNDIIEEQMTAVVGILSQLRVFCLGPEDPPSPAYVDMASFPSSVRRCKSIPLKMPLLFELLDMFSNRSFKVREASRKHRSICFVVAFCPDSTRASHLPQGANQRQFC